jgi:hypothetical protein
MLNKKNIVVALGFILLAGCSNHLDDYPYLMTHPKELEAAASRCQADNSLDCTQVNRAAQDFFQLISQRRQNPEVFGKVILAAEADLVAADAKRDLAMVGDQSLAQLRENADEQQQRVKVLMAVVKVTSTE